MSEHNVAAAILATSVIRAQFPNGASREQAIEQALVAYKAILKELMMETPPSPGRS